MNKNICLDSKKMFFDDVDKVFSCFKQTDITILDISLHSGISVEQITKLRDHKYVPKANIYHLFKNTCADLWINWKNRKYSSEGLD